MDEIAIRTVGLSKTYRSRRTSTVALERLDLAVPTGQFLGLLGPNGAGKTTTIRLLCGLLAPTAGQVFINGIPMHERPDAARAQIGLLPEDAGDHRNLSLIEELCYYGALYGLPPAEVKRRSEPLLARLDLAGRAKDRVKTFSRGMRRKFHLIRALIHQPRLLLLDEPTAGLDPAVMEEVWDLLKGLVADHGVTVVLCSHHLEEVERLCDRIVILKQKLLLEGTLAQLSASDRRYTMRLASAGMGTGAGWRIAEQLALVEGVLEAKAIDHSVHFQVTGSEEQVVPEVVRRTVTLGGQIMELSRDSRDLRSLYREAIGETEEA